MKDDKEAGTGSPWWIKTKHKRKLIMLSDSVDEDEFTNKETHQGNARRGESEVSIASKIWKVPALRLSRGQDSSRDEQFEMEVSELPTQAPTPNFIVDLSLRGCLSIQMSAILGRSSIIDQCFSADKITMKNPDWAMLSNDGCWSIKKVRISILTQLLKVTTAHKRRSLSYVQQQLQVIEKKELDCWLGGKVEEGITKIVPNTRQTGI
ncbi:hypothetical protein ARMGADRAFT_1024141 [Armillaria gallica]|uniref:Uncharacterized protein n=1 Tax=Armillaria gallica TaxID=47427 RepID=A0A2H3EM26_ARMGA|nr:hypothetical protein ARMGADRAFT_1024141 [Armillaria gallica]